MNILFVILSYNRPYVFQECQRTLFENTQIRPDLTYILDDCSERAMRKALTDFTISKTEAGTPINLLINNRNLGVGHQFETAYALTKQHEPEIVCFIESDYIFRNNWLEDVMAVFEASPHTIAIAGTDHADMYQKRKTDGEFCKLMIDQFGYDLASRPLLYKPFRLATQVGPIEVFGVSNSCGCQILHFGRIKRMLAEMKREGFTESDYWRHMERGFHKGMDRQRASDAHMSGTNSFFWENWALYKQIDIMKNFGFLNILPSISRHLCSQGINGRLDPRLFPEGTDFPGVNSGTFPEDYNNWTRPNKV